MDKYQFETDDETFVVDYSLQSIFLKESPNKSFPFSGMDRMADGYLLLEYDLAKKEFPVRSFLPRYSILLAIPAVPAKSMNYYRFGPFDDSGSKHRMRSVPKPKPKANSSGKKPGKNV